MARCYAFVGPDEVYALAQAGIARLHVQSRTRFADVLAALDLPRGTDELTVTYIVDADAALWIADRHSEHVACARGGQVRAAGELTIAPWRNGIEVLEATNQSTGYCPEPSCWHALAAALDQAGLARPDGFAHAFEFRRCPGCGTNAIVKDQDFHCAICGHPLPAAWNFALPPEDPG
ncbi:MAG: hypothetical protein AAGD12_02225 [Pseudomonadota bacterium]